ncbi:MAG: autotransporter-associated beta strand repeat-containing protein [Verrucomicrobia bacterium]|nr:autotransporter-associated beta strand repeat-containing protein [Verrucomicrobiota bacterium]
MASNISWNTANSTDVWDFSTQNWLTGGNTATVFANGDNVTFGGTGKSISIPNNVDPASTMVTGGGYLFSGARIVGTLTTSGSGTLTLTNDNVFSQVTIGSGSTLQLGNGGTTGRVGSEANPAPIALNGTLISNRASSSSLTLRGAITGSGNLIVSGGGLSLLGENVNFSGNTIIRRGTLNWNANNALGTSTVTLNDASTGTSNTGLFRNANGTLTNSIVVANQGTGTTTIGRTTSGDTTVIYSGGITLNRSAVLSSGTEPAGLGVVRFSGSISGVGGVTISGNNVTELTGSNTFAGTTNVSGGTLAIGHASALQNSTLNTGSGGSTQITFIAPGTQTYLLGGLSGSNSLGLGANNLTVGANGQSTQFSGILSGSGNFQKTGGGTLTLSGNNSYTGATTINGGTLQIGSGGTTGSLGAGAVTNNGTLAFNRSNAHTVGNTIGGTGSVSIIGGGTTTFTGNNTYTGSTSVSSGTLVVNGNQTTATGTTTVANGGRLMGSGRLGGLTVISAGGMHAPGNSPGIQTFQNLEYQAGSIFEWDLLVAQSDPSSFEQTGRGTVFDGVDVTDNLTGEGAVFRINLEAGQDFEDAFWAQDRKWSGIFTSSNSFDLGSIFQSFEYYAGGSVIGPPTMGQFSFDENDLFYIIPEPGGVVMMLLAGLATFLLARRGRAKRPV